LKKLEWWRYQLDDEKKFEDTVYTVSRKKGATGFFAVTFANIDGFS